MLNFPVQLQAWKEFQGQCQITTLYHNCVTCPLTGPTVTSSGSQRDVDYYQTRAQIKTKFEDGTLALDDAESIGMFSKTFAVEESLTRKYLEHLEYIQLKKEKRSEERKRKKQEEIMKTYDDFDCYVGNTRKTNCSRSKFVPGKASSGPWQDEKSGESKYNQSMISKFRIPQDITERNS